MRLLSFLILFLAACQGPNESFTPAPGKPLREFRGIIHCHSLFSHDSKGTYEEILAAAKAAKIDFICMTDHPPKDDKGRPLREGWTGIHDGVLFIQGAEYSDQILALGIKEPITGKDRRETIKAIHEQGGVAIACHPELIDDWDAFAEADGMEIYNVHATLQRKAKDKVWMLRIPKFVTTHVRAEELTEQAILAAIRGGHGSSVVFEISGDPREAPSKGVEKAYLNGEYVGTQKEIKQRAGPNQLWISRLEYYREDGKPWILQAPVRFKVLGGRP